MANPASHLKEGHSPICGECLSKIHPLAWLFARPLVGGLREPCPWCKGDKK